MRTTRTRLPALLALVALACVLGAAWASFVPTSSAGVECGTWVSSTTSRVVYDGSYAPLRGRDVSEAYADTTLASCPDALSTRRGVALGLLGVAGAATAGGVTVALRHRRQNDDAGTSP
ncbi:hypothetical protein KLP28_08335 [Nocardioidaceae bacterium]|nr:hypothetical protein KLP28_08335 [Nocardioidaceae bacterium]